MANVDGGVSGWYLMSMADGNADVTGWHLTAVANGNGGGGGWCLMSMADGNADVTGWYLTALANGNGGGEPDQQAATETSERRQSDGYEVLPGERISGDYEHIVEETDQQAATETSERRQSDGYEVLPVERISGDNEHIVEDRRLSDGYESMLCEDSHSCDDSGRWYLMVVANGDDGGGGSGSWWWKKTDQQAATETSERRQSDGYEVLPGEWLPGDYEHIVKDRRLSDGYESVLNEDFPRNIPCSRTLSSSSHYQTIRLENLETLPQGASALSGKDEPLLKVSKSCGDLASGKANTFDNAGNRKTCTEQEPKPFCSIFGKRNNEEEEQPRLHCFMLRDSTDGGSFAGAFYSVEAEQCMELQDFSTRGRCSADADGECEYLTALDSSREHEDYLELIAD
ncbi:hypothetical protein PoB_004412400 [Plakobranchus ocellatus]|uniref:Uncharacterized protein n=1 Tax=Plakobranchus ocellatus TaxID=259542 RepID=A0AAV4BFH8_9GAST|nr:hypothetical protein PoB_004412400 [Plakobranchus ocellatus]